MKISIDFSKKNIIFEGSGTYDEFGDCIDIMNTIKNLEVWTVEFKYESNTTLTNGSSTITFPGTIVNPLTSPTIPDPYRVYCTSGTNPTINQENN